MPDKTTISVFFILPHNTVKPARQLSRIKVGSVSLPLWQHKEGWRWAWKTSDGKWKYGTRKNYDEAVAAAKAQAKEISDGKLDLAAITTTQADLVRQFLALDPTAADLQLIRNHREQSSATLTVVVARWCESKLAEVHGKESPHLRNVRQWLEKFAKAFPLVPASSITVEQLRKHIESATDNPKSRRDARTRIVTLWRFARTHDLFDSTEADKLPTYRSAADKSVVIWTPAEMKKLLTGCPAEFLPWLVLASFSGLRSQEISSKEGDKPLLRWENIRRASEVGGFGNIDLPAAASKVRKRRLIPITPTLAAWLDHIEPPTTGIICPRLPAEHVTGTIGKLVNGWKKNALRHSYGSYRAAITKNLAELALEMGTSVVMIEKHYREAVGEEVAAKYWNLIPLEVFRKIP